MTANALRLTDAQFAELARKRLQRHEQARVSVPDAEQAFDREMTLDTTGVCIPRGAGNYGNIPTDGEASKKQARRLSVLRLMNEAGQIRGLGRQVEYVLLPKQARERGEIIERKLSYVADFVYEEWTSAGWKLVVEDVKGFRTQHYIIKRKLMLAIHGIEIRET